MDTLPFPKSKPNAYLKLTGEPVFNAEKHLDLGMPETITSLTDLGYTSKAVDICPSKMGITSAFKILSDEGVQVMTALAKQMYSNRNENAGTGENRLGSFIRGAGYRSQFINDFCNSTELSVHLSKLANTSLARHSVPAVACGINYAPDDVTKAVDTWHVDSVSFDIVLLLTNPQSFKGGEFQYFKGTKQEGQDLLGISGEEGGNDGIPETRIETMNFPAAGYGFLQQGNMIFHRACRLLAPAERITMIPSFVVAPAHAADATNSVNMTSWTDPGIIPELTRHELWRASARLEQNMTAIDITDTPEKLRSEIDDALAPLLAFRDTLLKRNM